MAQSSLQIADAGSKGLDEPPATLAELFAQLRFAWGAAPCGLHRQSLPQEYPGLLQGMPSSHCSEPPRILSPQTAPEPGPPGIGIFGPMHPARSRNPAKTDKRSNLIAFHLVVMMHYDKLIQFISFLGRCERAVIASH